MVFLLLYTVHSAVQPDSYKCTHTVAFSLQLSRATYLRQFNPDFDAVKNKIIPDKQHNQSRYYEGSRLIILG